MIARIKAHMFIQKITPNNTYNCKNLFRLTFQTKLEFYDEGSISQSLTRTMYSDQSCLCSSIEKVASITEFGRIVICKNTKLSNENFYGIPIF